MFRVKDLAIHLADGDEGGKEEHAPDLGVSVFLECSCPAKDDVGGEEAYPEQGDDEGEEAQRALQQQLRHRLAESRS